MKELNQQVLTDSQPLTKIFESLPGLYLILSPDLMILTASDSYLKATFTQRDSIVGRHLFDVFPDNPSTPEADGVENLSASLKKVLHTKQPHKMTVQRYDVQGPAGNEFVERYWQPLNTPVLNEDNEVEYIIHNVTDVTETEKGKDALNASQQREKNALAEVKSQKIQLQNLFEEAPIAITILSGPEYVIELVNPAICEIWDRLASDIVGKPLFEALPEVRGQGLEALLEGVLQTGIPYVGKEVPILMNRANGPEVIYFNFVYKPLVENGSIRSIIVVATDVTDQVLSRKEIEGKQNELIEVNNELALVNEELQASVEELNATNDELLNTQKALSDLNVHQESLIFSRTEQLNIAKQEAESNRVRLNSVFMQAPVGIAIYQGRKLNIELANPTICKMLGKNFFELKDKPLFEAIPEVRGQGFEEIFERVFEGKKAVECPDLPATISREGKSEKGFYHVILHPILNHKGEVTGVIEIASEVTDSIVAREKLIAREKELEALTKELAAANEELVANNEDLAQTNQKLLRLNSDLDNFIYTASHDLKAPIANIEGLIIALNRSISPEGKTEVDKYIKLMETSILRFRKTVESLTEVAKLQKEEDVLDNIGFYEVLEEVKLDLSNAIEETKTTFEISDCNCPFRFSYKNFKSIIYNLLSNAIKYHSPERSPIVKIKCYEDGEYKVISFQDNGLGMDLTKGPKIFSMFKRLHNHVEGSGVGLFIVKKIIENAGGKIEVESKLNEGSIFRVFFRQ
jgi:two-component system, sensor histidine kinase